MVRGGTSESESSSDSEGSDLSDSELQEAYSKGLLKPGLNVVEEVEKQCVNNVVGLNQCLEDFKKDLKWVERLDVTNGPAADVIAKAEGRCVGQENSNIDPEDDFQREMFFYRQAQATALDALPRLQRLKIATKRPSDYFAEMAKSDQQMQKIREKMISKQMSMEKSEKAKQLRALRKYGKKVQVEVIQKRQKEKKAMMTAVKKYQKGLSDKLDFLEGDEASSKTKSGGGLVAGSAQRKKGINAKRKYKNEKFGFGGRKKGLKWNTKESYDDVSSFKAKIAHSKNDRFGKGGKKNANKRPGKRNRQKMKNRSRK
ncbi:probable rRNA-processing protein EBP2 [Pristis pectinata]|uniref:probable rRNA-processing protein EBP2 n=1 Tax=Pristis pectinata TaxID=685728 RepID=UPI00223D18BE|nr:probable rRNA-processing protein EBP2 [Pristis pectinata]